MADLAGQIAGFAQDVLQTFAERAASLNFSKKSLDTIEEILTEAAPYFPKMERTQQDGLVQIIASYVLETARKTYGGKYYWHDAKSQPVLVVGEPRLRIALLPWDRVRNRLNGDPADNIPFFYAGFSERVDRGTSGDDALFV